MLLTSLPEIEYDFSPQQNVLFPFLTVREHLNHFGSIKGLYGEALRQSVRKCIDDVGLTEKENSFSKSLSGGMKRKLCLAIALIGDPKLVLLDEVSLLIGLGLVQRHICSD